MIRELTELGVETRPIIAGNFMKQPVIDYFTYIGRNATNTGREAFYNADYLHENGFFIGNDMTNLEENIDMVYNAIRQINSTISGLKNIGEEK